MIGYVVAGALVLGLFVGGSLYIAVLQDRVKVERLRKERLQAEWRRSMQQYEVSAAGLNEQLLTLQAASAEQWRATIDALVRRDELLEKLTVAPPQPEGGGGAEPLITDQDPTLEIDDDRDWTDSFAFGGADPSAGQMAPGMPTVEEMQRGE